MQKKLTAQGPKNRQSFTLTLPIDWVKRHKLTEKRSVELTLVGQKIVVSAGNTQGEEVFIDATTYTRSLLKVLQGLYRAGVSRIKLQKIPSSKLDDVAHILDHKLLGYHIVEQKKDTLVIEDIIKESEDAFPTVMRRIFLLLLQLSDSSSLEEALVAKHALKKFINYAQRIIVKKGHFEYQKSPLYYLILDRLEKLSDEWMWLIELNSQRRGDDEHKLLLRKAYELFYRFEGKSFSHYEYKTYLLKNKIKKTSKLSREALHLATLARILNSLYGDIYAVRYDMEK